MYVGMYVCMYVCIYVCNTQRHTHTQVPILVGLSWIPSLDILAPFAVMALALIFCGLGAVALHAAPLIGLSLFLSLSLSLSLSLARARARAPALSLCLSLSLYLSLSLSSSLSLCVRDICSFFLILCCWMGESEVRTILMTYVSLYL